MREKEKSEELIQDFWSEQTGKMDSMDRVWSGEEKKLNLGQATF